MSRGDALKVLLSQAGTTAEMVTDRLLGSRSVRSAFSVPVRYVVVGVWNTVFTVVLFAILLWVFQVVAYGWILLATVIISVVQAHLTQRTWVWRSREPFVAELARFSLVYVALYFINLGLLTACVEIAGWPVLGSQIAITCLLVIVGFFVNRGWTFARRAHVPDRHLAPNPDPAGQGP